MKTIIVATLYVIGVFIHMLWMIETEREEKVLETELSNESAFRRLPENVANILVYVVFFGISLIWPYTIVEMPIKELVKKLKRAA